MKIKKKKWFQTGYHAVFINNNYKKK